MSPVGIELTARERRWFDAILVLGALVLGFILIGYLNAVFTVFGDLIMVFFLAWLFAFMLSPVINVLRNAVPFLTRAGAILIVYGLLFGGLVVVSILVAAALATSIADFLANLPQLRADLPAILAPWQQRLNDLGISQVDLLAQATVFLDNINQYALQAVAPLQEIAVASLGAIGNLLLVVVFSLYMVADRDRLVAFLFALVPAGYKAEAQLLEEAVARSFGGFIRGQAVTGLAFGAVVLVASLVFGLDFMPVTTATAALLMAIPFFGPFVSWVPPVLVAFLFKPEAAVGTSVVVAVGWLVIMNWLAPLLMANALRIHPIVVLASVIVGIKVAGIAGAIFGIPVAAVLSALFLHAVARQRGGTPVAERAAERVGRREGRAVRRPREPDPTVDSDVEPAAPPVVADTAGEARPSPSGPSATASPSGP